MKAKTFLIITSHRAVTNSWLDREKYLNKFIDQLAAQVEEARVLYTTYDDISCLVKSGTVTMIDQKNQIDLKDVALVHFKNWMLDAEQAATIVFYLKCHSVAFYNSEVDSGLAGGKIAQMCRLAMIGVPVPDTFFAKRESLSQIFASGNLPNGFQLPLILKADNGSKGEDNYLIKSFRKGQEILASTDPDKDFVLQNYIPNEGDYRFLFMGLDEPPMVFLRRGVSGSHLNNTSQGGQGSLVPAKEIPKEYVQLARRSAEALSREICGVDILVDSVTQKAYILEVNSTPAIATGYALERKVAKFASFLTEVLEQREEE